MRKVILVDDEYWTLQGLQTMFGWERYGYEVCGTFESAMQALEAITALQPDLVLTDIRMPVISGLDLIHLSHERGVFPVFVVISGYSEFEYARNALKEGAFDYLLKPVSYEDADALLQRLAEHFSSGQEPDEKPLTVHTDNAQLNDLLQYVHRHYNESLKLKELARQFYMNPTYCSEVFNKKTGMSFSNYVNQLRINKSCALLCHTDLTMNEIAQQSGFVDCTHFYKTFKSIKGESPLQYRKARRLP